MVCYLIQGRLELPPHYRSKDPKPYSAPYFKFISMGYWPATVDWMWIQTLQIIGGRQYTPEVMKVSRNFYELATDLDPRFYKLYEDAGIVFSVFFKSPDDAIHFLEKGVQNIHPSWSHPYTLYLLLAHQYGYEKQDWAKAKQSFLKASELEGSPEYLDSVKVWLEKEGGEKRLAKQVLKQLIQNIDDDELKEEYRKQLEKL